MIRRACLAALLTFLAAGVPRASQEPVFTARTSVVRVDVLVTHRGEPVKDLRRSDFEVRDNGVRQDVEFALFEQTPVFFAVALDVSGSVAGDRLRHFRTAFDGVLNNLRADDRLALISFSHQVSMETSEAVSRERLRVRLGREQGVGATSLYDAAHAGLVLSDREAERGLLLVFSDGLDTSSWLSPARVLETAKRGQVVSYVVSTAGTRNRFLRDLVSLTGGSYLEIESTRDLDGAFARILDEFRNRYLLSYRPQGVPAGGWHRIDVRVRRPGVSVKARTGYLSSR